VASAAEPTTQGGVGRLDRWRPFGVAVAIAVAYAVLVLSTHSDLFAAPGRTLGGDARTSYWQDVVFAVESLRAGELPLWNPYERGGYPFSADPQTALWSPLSWLVYLLGLASGGHGHWLQELRQFAAPILAACGMHLFLRRRGLRHPAAGLAGTILVAGAFAQRTIMMATYWPWAYLGFVLAAVDALAPRPGWTRMRWLALTLLLLATSGFPPSIFYALLIAVPYALLRLITADDPHARRRTFLGMTGAAAIASVGALIIVLPLFEQTALSWRATRGLDYILSNPASFADLWTLLDPTIRGKQLFVGLLGALMALLALSELRRPGRRAEVIFWICIAVAGILLAAAKESPLLGWCATALPGFDLFRIASRYTILTHTGLAVLAAYGLDRAITSARARPSYVHMLAWTCLLVQCVDLQRISVKGRLSKVQEVAAGEALARELDGARAYNEWSLGARGGAVFSVRDWRGRSKDPMSFARYQEVEARVRRDPAILRHFAVTQLLVGGRRQIAARPRIPRPRAIRGIIAESPTRFRLPEPAPEVYWSAKVITAAPDQGLDALSMRPPGMAIVVDEGELRDEEHAFIAGPSRRQEDRGQHEQEARKVAPSVAGTISHRERNRLIAEIDAPAAGLVAIAEVWHPGWRATVDGETAIVHRVNHLVRGLVVGPGAHRIELTYRPRSLPWVFGLYALAWTIILVDPRPLLRSRR